MSLQRVDATNQPGADLRSRTLAWADGDLSRIQELAERTRDGGVWSVPTLVGVGAPLMAGTDTPPLGFALHRELEELVGAGLSPYEALEAATVNPARFLVRGVGVGMVVEGSPADLVLLDGNPLEDIGNTRRIAGVVRRGEWLDRATLDAMLEEGAGR